LASRQGFGELKTEQLGGHSQEQQRHRQAPIDDDVVVWRNAPNSLHKNQASSQILYGTIQLGNI